MNSNTENEKVVCVVEQGDSPVQILFKAKSLLKKEHKESEAIEMFVSALKSDSAEESLHIVRKYVYLVSAECN